MTMHTTKIRGGVGMTQREFEHYDIARQFTVPFTRTEFSRLYRQRYPNRKPNSIMPYEFCGNRAIPTATNGPKFMQRLALGRYQFTDL
jgi:hypothetical protein